MRINLLRLILVVFSLLFHFQGTSQVINRDPEQRKDFANVFYKPQYTLFDLRSDEPIFPYEDGKYHIYYASNEVKTPTSFVGSASELTRLVQYKFKDLESCKLWCGEQNGEGSIILADGKKITGLWVNGEFKGEWKLVDNRHKCNHCNIKMAQSTKRTDTEISQLKKEANSNEIELYKNKLYCSSACELKVVAERKALEKQYAKESKAKSKIYKEREGYSGLLVGYCKNGKIYKEREGYSGLLVGYFENGKIYKEREGYSGLLVGFYEGGESSAAAAALLLLL